MQTRDLHRALCVIRHVEFKVWLKQLSARLRPAEMRQFHEELLPVLRRRVRQWIYMEGPRLWEPLKPTWTRRSVPFLTLEGRLLKSLYDESSPDHIERATAKGIVFGSKLEIARYHHEGTKPYRIRPRRAKALRFVRADGTVVFTAQVHHPGLPARPLMPPVETLQSLYAERFENYLMGE